MKRRKRPSERPSTLATVVEWALWLLVVVLLIYRVGPQVQAAFGVSTRSSAAPAVNFALLDGSSASLDAKPLRGQVVLVNFWATWCPPCRFEMPGFEKVYDAKHADGFTIVGVSADEGPRDDVVSFLKERGIKYPVAMMTPEIAAAFGGINSFPTSFLIDRRGNVRYVVRGIFAEVALHEAVKRLLAEGT